MNVLQDEFLEEVKNITELSKKVNKNNTQKIFEMIKEHSGEINELYLSGSDHWSVETADLMVLCFELLVGKNKDIDLAFQKSLPRFYKKLNELQKQN